MRPQVAKLMGFELEHEVPRKSAAISPNLLVQPLGFDGVEKGQVGIEDDLVAPQHEDGSFDALGWQEGRIGHRWSWSNLASARSKTKLRKRWDPWRREVGCLGWTAH